MTTRKLAKRHVEVLAASAITEQAATAWGVTSAHDDTDLPAALRENPHAVDNLPGMVFPIRRLDGTVTYQLRPDTPIAADRGNSRKYIQESGVGSVINVPASMADRVGVAPTVLIVEGTKQTIAVSQYVPDDTLVVGVQGSSNWSHDGVPVDDLIALCETPNVTRVEILFDADVNKNANVYEAAQRIQSAMRIVGGVSQVVFVRLATGGYGGKAGIDDALGAKPEAERFALLQRLRNEATGKLGRRPARPKDDDILKDAVHEVRMDEGRTMVVSRGPDGETTSTELLAWAAQIVAVEPREREVGGRFSLVETMLHLEVAIRQPNGTLVTTEHEVLDTKFESVNDWLSALGPVAYHVERIAKPSDQVAVANIIRASSPEPEIVRKINRTGWMFDRSSDGGGQWRWMYPHGAIGAHDVSENLRGAPSASMFDSMDLPDPNELAPEVIAEAVRSFIGVRDLIEPGHELAWDAAIGAFGLAFLPVPPKTALAYFGRKSSGKSTLAQALASALSPRWSPNGTAMMTFNSTVVAMDVVAAGLSNCFLHVDDLKPEHDPRRRAEVNNMLDELLRRSHGSGGRARGGLTSAREVMLRERDDSAPLLIVTGEEIPTGGDFAESGLDRMFIVETPDFGLMRRRAQPDGGHDDGEASLQELYGRLKDFPIVTAAYVRWLASRMQWLGEREDFGSVSAQAAKDRLTQITDVNTNKALTWLSRRAEETNVHMTSRARGVAARLIAGYACFLAFAAESEYISTGENERLSAAIRDSVFAQAATMTRDIMADNAADGDTILHAVRESIATGRATTAEPRAGQTQIGAPGKARLEDGQRIDVINLIPAAIEQITRWPGGKKAVIRALSGYALPGNNGRLRNARVNGTVLPTISIPLKVWQVLVDDDADEGMERL